MEKNNQCFSTYPKRNDVLNFVFQVRNYIHPGYFEILKTSETKYREKKLKEIEKIYKRDICKDTFEDFKKRLPEIENRLNKDIEFFLESDPAIEVKEEVVITYPGYFAILFYRIAHELVEIGIPIIPRVISEIAHSMTGIDIHPGAKIGSPLFIDHGTGIVIGETAEIGNYVKIYHGVTLGALSLKEGSKLKGTKRHPTVKDYVTIYSGASILGGETVIEENVTIGSNVFIVNSVLKDSTLIYSADVIKFKGQK